MEYGMLSNKFKEKLDNQRWLDNAQDARGLKQDAELAELRRREAESIRPAISKLTYPANIPNVIRAYNESSDKNDFMKKTFMGNKFQLSNALFNEDGTKKFNEDGTKKFNEDGTMKGGYKRKSHKRKSHKRRSHK